jgi:hypothetical protein
MDYESSTRQDPYRERTKVHQLGLDHINHSEPTYKNLTQEALLPPSIVLVLFGE